ncbi:MAG: hypothetical protein HFJ40_00985 [Clostridia bacterium]|nr:hypothetical protein [Clostridia bacterium]
MLQDDYDELKNIVLNLKKLTDETNNEFYKVQFNDLKEIAERDLEAVVVKLKQEQKQEAKQLEREYRESRGI